MGTRFRVAVILSLAVAAACRNTDRPPPGNPVRAAETRRERPQAWVVERRLAPSAALEAQLASGETHSYRVDLAAGQYADLTVEQRGVDVVVVLRSPDGRPLRRVDSLAGDHGPEPLPFIAERTGAYRVEVRSLDAQASGPYTIVLRALRPPSPRDRSLVAAEATFAMGEELRRKGGEAALRQAVEHHHRALELFRSSGAANREADVLLSLGSALSDLGEYLQARAAYGRALALFRTAGRTRQLSPALIGLGRAFRHLGETSEALRCYRESLSVSREVGSRWDEVTTLGNLGRAYATLGRFEDALAAYEQALAGWQVLGVAGEQAAALDQLGQLYLKLGDEGQAVDRFEEALAILEKAGKTASTGTIRASLGSAYVRMGQYGKGIEDLQRALQLHRQAGNRRDEAVVLNNLGVAYRQTGALGQARRHYAAALARHRALGDRSEEAITLLNLGSVHVDLGDPAAAIGFFQSVLPWFVGAADQADEAATLLGLAQARRQQGELAAAQHAIEEALERVERLRTKPAEAGLRASYFASKQQYFAFYIDLLMEMHRLHPAAGYDADAFEASERGRARTLLEDLVGGGEPRGHGQLADEVAAVARRLQNLELQRLEPAAAAAPAERREAADRELRRVLGRYRRLRAALRGGSATRSTVSQAEPLPLEVIQRRVLDGETLLLEYYLGEARSFLWAVTPTSLESFELPGRAIVEAAARRALELLPESHRRTARVQTEIALQELSRLLLAPVGDRLAGRRLLVVADGVLHYLPFAALPVPAAAAGAGAGGLVPLMVKHEVVTLPSASTVAVLRHRDPGRLRARAAVAVLADPVFSPGDPRVVGPRPGSGRNLPATRFPRLPFSRQEAESILALTPAGQGLGLLGFDASRETAEGGSLARYRYVHFATHGILDTTYPELSGIVLSLVDRHGRPENGFLWAHEIAGLHLNADLVCLSACRTALGKEIRGEGLVGLTRAFLDAGAKAVLVSLWQVEDRATAELMRRLYEGILQQGLPPAAALRQAQISLWQGGDWRAPYYWAGFVLQGEWR
jgi:CHAT domain-containing protein/Tfp pilus assembly protein PilF